MKVLFVSSGNNKYGIVPFIKSQGESLKANGVDLDYFTIKGKGIKGYLANIKPLKEKIKKGKYDVVHSHYTFCGWVSLIADIKSKHVISFMGSDTYGEYDENGRRSLSSLYIVFLAKLLQIFVKAIIVKSQNLAEYVHAKKKLNIVPNGVNFEKFYYIEKETARDKLGLDQKKKIILFLSDPKNKRKNFKLLAAAYSLVKHKNTKILQPFPVDPDLVPFFINACDVLVQPSVQEGSSNLVKEAMACNCPVISTDSGDAVEVIGETDNCAITEFNPKDLASKIEKVISCADRTNGRENIKHLEINAVAQKIIKIYESIL